MEIERKYFTGIDLKADKPGAFTAKIAELNVIDKDGDVTLPGAFPDGKAILISAYQHGSWDGGLPVGKGTVHEKGNDVIVKGQFNLNTVTGKEHYETVKFAPDLQEWSYGFSPTEFERDTEFEGHAVSRILKKVDPFEASPVLRGAGNNTGTMSIKSEEKGTTYTQKAEAALATVTAFLDRTKSLADLRREEGRDLSEANVLRVKSVMDQLCGVLTEMGELTKEPEAEPDTKEAERVMLEFIRVESKLAGVKM
jgi:phage head maturation protease